MDSGQARAKRLIFFGTDNFSVPTLRALIDGGFNVIAVITKPDAAVGRGRVITPPAVKTLAVKNNIIVLQPAKLSEIVGDITVLKPEIGVVVAYGKIIPSAIIDLFPIGLINAHGSLLPKYRGSSPIEAAIINGDSKTGISVMRINEAMDAGPVYRCFDLPLNGAEARPELFETMSELAARAIAETLPDIIDGSLRPTPQDDAEATYVKMIVKADGDIDWRKPAAILAREVRAYLGWPGSRAHILNTDVTITAARAIESNASEPAAALAPSAVIPASKDLLVATGNGILAIDRLKPAGKREMTGREFLVGRPRC